MADIAEVKAALDGAAQLISGAVRTRANVKAQLLAARNQLVGIPAQFAAEIASIKGYTPTGAFETLAKDELAKLSTQFSELQAAIETELTALGVSYS